MAGVCRLHGNVRHLLVAHFSDQNDLGGLAEQRPQTPREREADGLVDLGLADARDENLDRIFQADDAEPFPVHFLDGRVKGRRLA